jgi:hypothetical protein
MVLCILSCIVFIPVAQNSVILSAKVNSGCFF